MSTHLIWDNLVAYSLQIGLLVGLAAFVPTLLRLKMPHAKLAYWHILLAACLLLPAVRPVEAGGADRQHAGVHHHHRRWRRCRPCPRRRSPKPRSRC